MVACSYLIVGDELASIYSGITISTNFSNLQQRF